MILLFLSLVLITFAIWLGAQLTVTFIVAPKVFSSLEDRSLAGDVMGAIFSAYFNWQLLALITLIGTLFIAWFHHPHPPVITLYPIILACTGLLMVAISRWVIMPKAHDVKTALRNAAKSDVEKLQSRFKRLHGLSMLLNLATLTSAFFFAVSAPIWIGLIGIRG